MSEIAATPCRLCGHDAQLMAAQVPGYQAPDTFAVYHCPNCYTSFSLPLVDTSALYDTIYRLGAAVPGYSRYWHYKDVVSRCDDPLRYLCEHEDVYWSVVQALRQHCDASNARVLEIGCGMGYLTAALSHAGYDILGVDIAASAIARAVEAFGPHYHCADVLEYAETHAGEYDAVIMTEVIEHVEQPTKFIAAALRMLRPGGHLIVTTPNKTIFPPHIVWRSDNPPVHCWWLSERSLQQMARDTNSAVEFLDFSDFYRTRRLYINMAWNKLFAPRLTADGRVNSGRVAMRQLSLLQRLRNRIARISLYRRLKAIVSPNMFRCGKAGPTICAIFIKNKI